MNFAHPWLLAAGLGAVALPILIHILMRRRRRPMRWAAMRFLIQAAKRQRQRVRFEQLLLLLARCLIVALAALAIARPTLPGGDPLLGSRATTLYLVLDNSLTSSVGVPDALSQHQLDALNLLERLDPLRGDRAALISLASPSTALLSPATSDLQSVGAAIRNLSPAHSSADLQGSLTRLAADISQDAAGGSRSVVAILSEFRAGSAPIDRPLPPLGESPDLAMAASRPVRDPIDNTAITAVEPLRPIVLGQADASTTQVRIRAARFGPSIASRAEAPVELLIADTRVVARGTLVFEPGSRDASIALGIDGAALGDLRRDGPGPITITARLTMRDALLADDLRRAVIERRESLVVGLVAPRRFGPLPSVSDYRAADWAQAALDPEALRDGAEIRVQGIDPAAVDASTLAGLEAVVIAEPQSITIEGWSALRRFADLGGLILLFPQPGPGAQVWTDAALSAFDVPWELPREGMLLSNDEPATATPPAPTPAGPTAEPITPADATTSFIAATLARPETPSPLVAMIEGELTDLLRPIALTRAMPVTLRSTQGTQTLLTLGDTRPIMVAAAPGSRAILSDDPLASTSSRGLIIYLGLALDLDWSDLPTKPLLLPLIQEVIRQGVSHARGGWVIDAGATPVAAAGAVELNWLAATPPPPGGLDTIPLHPSGLARQPIRHAGAYQGVDSSGAPRGLVLVNPATAASNTDLRSDADIASWLATAGVGRAMWLDADAALAGDSAAPGSAPSRRDWSWLPALFAAALALAILEAIAARFFSHALVSQSREAA